MAQPDFENLVAFLEETPDVVKSLTGNLTAKELMRKPAIEEFSFLEHVCHLRDIEREGYGVRIAKLLNEEQPFLPDIDGGRVIHRLKNDISTRHIPICVISTEEARTMALNSRAMAFFEKPVKTKYKLDAVMSDLRNIVRESEKTL